MNLALRLRQVRIVQFHFFIISLMEAEMHKLGLLATVLWTCPKIVPKKKSGSVKGEVRDTRHGEHTNWSEDELRAILSHILTLLNCLSSVKIR